MPAVPADPPVTLGLLAGGRATRLAGIDKAWLRREGIPQVLRLATALAPSAAAVLVSANRNLERYAGHGLRTVPDRIADLGPIGGLEALLDACRDDWLLTLPVDATCVPPDLLATLRGAGAAGAYVLDEDGPQPLAALWPVHRARQALAIALADGEQAVHRLQSRLQMPAVRFPGLRLGNLNTPAQLMAAGVAADHGSEGA